MTTLNFDEDQVEGISNEVPQFVCVADGIVAMTATFHMAEAW